MDRLEGNFLVCPTTPNGQEMIKTDKTFIRPGAGHVYIQGANIYSIMMIEHSYGRQLTDSKGSLTKISYLYYAVLRTHYLKHIFLFADISIKLTPEPLPHWCWGTKLVQ